MKTSTVPSHRVEPELREAAEDVLQEGESLSCFVEQSIRTNIERRRVHAEFIARGLASRDEARRTGRYVPVEEVLRGLDAKLEKARSKAGRQKGKSLSVDYRVRFSEAAVEDVNRLYDFLLERDLQAAERAREAIFRAMDFLRDFPFACRKASSGDPFMRELVIPFGAAGYVALFEIDDSETVTVYAIRHQLEDDYH